MDVGVSVTYPACVRRSVPARIGFQETMYMY